MSVSLVRVGDLIRIPEADYRYGLGELRLRVVQVPRSAHIPGLEWIEVIGVPVRTDGRTSPPRTALIRVAALRMPGRVIRSSAPELPPADNSDCLDK